MRSHNAKKPNEKPFIEIFLAALSHLGNMVIIALGVIYFGIKKIFFALKKKKDNQTLNQFIKNLERYLLENSNRFELGKNKGVATRQKVYTRQKSSSSYNNKVEYIAPAWKQPIKHYTNHKKSATMNSKTIDAIRVATVIATAGLIVFIIIISVNGFGGKDALAERNDLNNNSAENSALTPLETFGTEPIDGLLEGTPENTPEVTPEITTEVTASMENSPEPSAQTEVAPGILIHIDETNDLVAPIQERLMKLHYMDSDEPTTFYGPVTEYAIQLFQRGHSQSVDGVAGYETLKLLFSDEAKPYLVRKGDKGTDIAKIQERLNELGYIDDDDRDGRFDEDTDYAIRMFQGRNKLSQDGIVGHNTTQVLFNGDAKPAKNHTSGSNNSSQGSSGGSSGGSSNGGSYNANDAASLVAFAKTLIGQGIPYTRGGKTASGLDCSGFVYYCLNQTGNSVGYKTSATWAQSSYASIGSMDDVKPGDILCFDGHVGIYIGDGKMIDASSSQNGIRITNVKSSTYWNGVWVCGKRVFS